MKILFILIPVLLQSYTLKDLIRLAKSNNHLIKSKGYEISSNELKLKSLKSTYLPTLDIQGFYQNKNNPEPFTPKGVYSAGMKLDYIIYDGSKREYDIKSKEDEKTSSKYKKISTIKDIELAITKEFFTILSLKSKLEALKKAKQTIYNQLNKVKEFYKVKLATQDKVDRLQSAYSNVLYEIEILEYEIVSHKKELELLVDKPITNLERSSFIKEKPKKVLLDEILSLKYKASSLKNISQTIDSYYYPQIKISDQYNFYGYQDKPDTTLPVIGTLPIDYPKKQNMFLISIGFRVFDFGGLKDKKESVIKQQLALNEKIVYKQKEQDKNIFLAKKRIETAKASLKASQDSLKAAKSGFLVIKNKYEANLVDNVVYLDALSNLTKAKARYEDAKNQLELSYGIFYYFLGKDLEEFIR